MVAPPRQRGPDSDREPEFDSDHGKYRRNWSKTRPALSEWFRLQSFRLVSGVLLSNDVPERTTALSPDDETNENQIFRSRICMTSKTSPFGDRKNASRRVPKPPVTVTGLIKTSVPMAVRR